MMTSLTRLTKLHRPDMLQVNAPSPTRVFGSMSALGALAVLALSNVLLGLELATPSVMLAIVTYTLAALVCMYAMHKTYPHDRVGLCNLVTLARLVIVGVLLVAMLEPVPATTTLLALAVFSLCLDGVDGWLARRQNLVSTFGARFDVEVDAAFALLLAVYAARTGAAELHVLLLGVPHYLFWIARTLLPWLNAPLPERFSRKAICVLQIATLIALLVPFFSGAWLNGLVLITVLALIWSFGRDIRWLYRTRP